MQVIPVTDVSRGFGSTSRRDAWWVAPLAVFLGLSTFVVYSTWAAFQNAHYTFGPYLSPFYAPVLWASPGDTGGLEHAWFGVKPDVVSGAHSVFAGAPDSSVPRPFPLHLLLLPRRVLQVRSGPTRRRAPSASRARATGASSRSRSSCRTCTATSSYIAVIFLVHAVV